MLWRAYLRRGKGYANKLEISNKVMKHLMSTVRFQHIPYQNIENRTLAGDIKKLQNEKAGIEQENDQLRRQVRG